MLYYIISFLKNQDSIDLYKKTIEFGETDYTNQKLSIIFTEPVIE